ncbi:MAG: mechanosensitive ion channel family protein [Wenzhouxiangellaceae bacterium]|nr:MAG: mechanosensitive ion channel family protein [Wenzhouxiangellaceae bacterium]
METFQEWLTSLELADVLAVAWQVLGAILIFIVGRWIARAVVRLLRNTMKKREVDELIISFLGNIVYVVLLLSVVLIAVGYLGVQVTPLIAILGGAALAVGLALQSSLSNFASGLMIVGFRPFTRGHFVEAGGVSGTVQKVGIFQTELKTPDNRHVIVPNSAITSSPITNYSAYETRRVDLVIGVDYGDDLKVARKTIERVLSEHEKVLDDPEPTIMVLDLGDSSVDFAVRPWVNASDFWPVRGELLQQLKEELEKAGCSIPFPQRDVHLHQTDKAA